MSANDPFHFGAANDEATPANLEAGTEPRDEAEFQTLENMLQNLGAFPVVEIDEECQRIVARVEAIGARPRQGTSAGAVSASQASLDLEHLGQYQLLAKLGQGGMGAVYKALHTKLNRLVALKVLSTARMQDAAAVARFEREMRAVGALAHENIVAAHDAGEIDGTHYLVMELVQGVDLSGLIKHSGTLAAPEACELIRQAALGLQHAYENNLVHRDIKPGNLMLSATPKGPQVKILDMGLALLNEQQVENDELTAAGQIMGTLDYMAPEQGGNTHSVDIRADIYSLGATLYKLLTGRVPFHGAQYNSTIKKLTALATQDPPRVDSFRGDLPGELVEVIHRMLARQPEDRYATPAEVATALERFALGADLETLLQTAMAAQVKQEEEQTALLRTASAQGESVSLRSSLVDTQSQVVARRSSQSSATAATVANAEPPLQESPPHRRKRSVWLACAAVPMVVALAAIVFSLRTPHGEVVVELADDIPAAAAQNLKIEVTGAGEVKVADAAAGWTIDIAEGKYQAKLSGGSDQFQLEQNQVTVTRGEKAFLKVTLKPVGKASAPQQQVGSSQPPAPTKPSGPWQANAEQQAFFDEVAKLPAEEQAAAVAKKLQEVNPGFDGKIKRKVEDGRVTELEFVVDEVTEIWPARALVGLKLLGCRGSTRGKGKLADLAPLRGMQLTYFSCAYTRVSDLSPLRGMPLTTLACPRTTISDLSPLGGMPLEYLDCEFTSVTDLSPLKGMPLTFLDCTSPLVSDLSPLKGMQLATLKCGGVGDTPNRGKISDLSPLKGMPLTKLACAFTPILDLSPLQGMQLTYLRCDYTLVSDLTPLKGMPLAELICNNVGGADLSPLEGMPLQRLRCDVRVFDFSPLKGMPLQQLTVHQPSFPLYDEVTESVLRTLPLRSIGDSYNNGKTQPATDFWQKLRQRRQTAESFAAETNKLPVEDQVAAIQAQLKDLNTSGILGLGHTITDNVVAVASLTLTTFSNDLTPIMAFSHVKKLTLIGGSPAQDITCVKFLPLEELNCTEQIALKNSPVLKTMKTLKTINGEPAQEYLERLRDKPPAATPGNDEPATDDASGDDALTGDLIIDE